MANRTKWSAFCRHPSTSRAKRSPARAASAKDLEIYKPLGYEPGDLKLHMGDFNYWTTARLRPGVSAARAQAELNVVQAAISKQLPGDLDLHASLIPLQERMVGDVRQGLVLLMAAVGAVLLVLCVNLANLSLARAAGRARDAAIRTALGASRGRLLGQSIVESTLLALTGGALGVVLAYWGLRALLAAAPIDLPRLQEVHVDAQVLLFALAISLLTGLIFGALPALRSVRSVPMETLKSAGRGNTEGRGGLRVRNLLVEPRGRSQRRAAGHRRTAHRQLRAVSCPSTRAFRWIACSP